MKNDEGFLDMLDKSILIQYQYENVIPFSYLRILKTPEKSITLAFFFVLNIDEQLDECLMNNAFGSNYLI